MKHLNRFRGRLNRYAAFWGLFSILACGAAYKVFSETLIMTAYYPSPFGAYTQFMTTQQAAFARDGGNVGIGIDAKAAGSKLTVKNGAGGGALNLLNSAGTSLFFVASNGNVGIGTTNPQAALDIAVTGGIKLAPGGTCASPSDLGKIAMIGSPATPQWCDGSSWKSL